MTSGLEDLRVLRAAEEVADEIWQQVITWGHFERDTLGNQLVRAVDSIGANIAESFGRYSFGEKLQFLYYARGSLFETKYWLNRALKRGLQTDAQHVALASRISGIAQQINAFAKSLKTQRTKSVGYKTTAARESASAYSVDPLDAASFDGEIVDATDLAWMSNPNAVDRNLPSPISNLQSL